MDRHPQYRRLESIFNTLRVLRWWLCLSAVAMPSLTPDLGKLGTRMCYAICSFRSLGGTPVSGAILTVSGNLWESNCSQVLPFF